MKQSRYINSPSYRTARERYGEPSLAYKVLSVALLLLAMLGILLVIGGLI